MRSQGRNTGCSWHTAYLYNPSSDTFEVIEALDEDVVPPPAETFDLHYSLDERLYDGYTSYILYSWEDQKTIASSERDINDVSCHLLTWKLEVRDSSSNNTRTLAGSECDASCISSNIY